MYDRACSFSFFLSLSVNLHFFFVLRRWTQNDDWLVYIFSFFLLRHVKRDKKTPSPVCIFSFSNALFSLIEKKCNFSAAIKKNFFLHAFFLTHPQTRASSPLVLVSTVFEFYIKHQVVNFYFNTSLTPVFSFPRTNKMQVYCILLTLLKNFPLSLFCDNTNPSNKIFEITC